MPHLLIVDDDDLVRNALSLVLEAFGHRVTVAASTKDALAHVTDGHWPDAVIADYRLRNHDTGVRAVQAVREALGEAVPALILTGDTSPERLNEIGQSGLAVLHKPVSGTALLDCINALLSRPGRPRPKPDQSSSRTSFA